MITNPDDQVDDADVIAVDGEPEGARLRKIRHGWGPKTAAVEPFPSPGKIGVCGGC